MLSPDGAGVAAGGVLAGAGVAAGAPAGAVASPAAGAGVAAGGVLAGAVASPAAGAGVEADGAGVSVLEPQEQSNIVNEIVAVAVSKFCNLEFILSFRLLFEILILRLN